MIEYLVFGLFFVVIICIVQFNKIKSSEETVKTLRNLNYSQQRQIEKIEEREKELQNREKVIQDALELEKRKRNTYWSSVEEDIKKILISKKEAFPYVASLISDLLVVEEEKYVSSLKYSSSIRNKEKVIRIIDLKNEKKKLIEEVKILTYQLETIYSLFPHLAEYNDYDDQSSPLEDDYHKYLTEDEYKALPDVEKNQRALDYYKKRKKTKWEIGRDFERYIGYTYEEKGYDVTYYGIEKKLEDLGRDIIAENKKEILIIQCKYWSKDKLIHEKHIAQLFGTYMMYKIENKTESRNIFPVFICHNELSEKAKIFAECLNVNIMERIEIGEYPLIKCNIGRDEYGTTTRIYHLPQDQQYDKVLINRKKGDLYCFTTAEAEKLKFRRAYKWHRTISD